MDFKTIMLKSDRCHWPNLHYLAKGVPMLVVCKAVCGHIMSLSAVSNSTSSTVHMSGVARWA